MASTQRSGFIETARTSVRKYGPLGIAVYATIWSVTFGCVGRPSASSVRSAFRLRFGDERAAGRCLHACGVGLTSRAFNVACLREPALSAFLLDTNSMGRPVTQRMPHLSRNRMTRCTQFAIAHACFNCTRSYVLVLDACFAAGGTESCHGRNGPRLGPNGSNWTCSCRDRG